MTNKKVIKYCFALDLKDDEKKIAEYKSYHKRVWPEITKSIKDAGVINAEIYNTGNRLFMIMEVDHTFTFQRKSRMDAKNLKVQEWEKLMWTYQKALPNVEKGAKWILMEQIYSLNE